MTRGLIVDTLGLVSCCFRSLFSFRMPCRFFFFLPVALCRRRSLYPFPSLSLTKQKQTNKTRQQMKSFEASGLTRPQAEELTTTLTQLLCLNRERISEGFVAKSALEKVVLEHEARVAALRSEVTKGQELHLASLARDTERLTASLDRVRSEIRTEADKLTAATRLDLNLEKGRMRDELQALRDKAAELEIKIDKETSALARSLESTKSEMVRYSLGLLLSASAVGATIFRLFSSK